jgi:hypothetical protein
MYNSDDVDNLVPATFGVAGGDFVAKLGSTADSNNDRARASRLYNILLYFQPK